MSIRDSSVEISEATNLEVVEIGKSQFLKLRSAVEAHDFSRVARKSCDTQYTALTDQINATKKRRDAGREILTHFLYNNSVIFVQF